jgi:hypothetical protein
VTCATYICTKPCTGDQLRAAIFAALKVCVVEQPILRTIISEAESEQPWLVLIRDIDLRDHVTFVALDDASNRSFEGLLERAHNCQLDEWRVRPRWRVYVMLKSFELESPAFDLAFAYSHALADGSSGFIFHQTFHQAMQSPKCDCDPVFEVSETAQGLLPPLEKAANLTISWQFLLRPLMVEYLPSWIVNRLGISSTVPPGLWTGAAQRPERPKSGVQLCTELCCVHISQEVLQGVLAACHAQKTRLTGLLSVVTARAMAKALHDRDQGFTKFAVQLPFDMRRVVPAARGCMANYPSTTTEIIDANTAATTTNSTAFPQFSEEEWAIARGITERLAERSRSLSDQPFALQKYLSDYRDWTLRQACKPSETSFEISNVGAVDFHDYSVSSEVKTPWRISDVTFSQSASVTGPPFNVNVASTQGGRLAIVLSWWCGMLGVGQDEHGFMRAVCKGITSQLTTCAN